LQNEQPNQFSSSFSSTNKEGRFIQVLFLNEYHFYVYPLKSNQIEIKATYEPKESFSFLILISFSFLSSNKLQSFQSRICFDQTHQSVFVQYTNTIEKIFKIRIDISDFTLDFSSIKSSPSSNISSPNEIYLNPSPLQNSKLCPEPIDLKQKSSVPFSSQNENISDKPFNQNINLNLNILLSNLNIHFLHILMAKLLILILILKTKLPLFILQLKSIFLHIYLLFSK
jgi:hypothetical protein